MSLVSSHPLPGREQFGCCQSRKVAKSVQCGEPFPMSKGRVVTRPFLFESLSAVNPDESALPAQPIKTRVAGTFFGGLFVLPHPVGNPGKLNCLNAP